MDHSEHAALPQWLTDHFGLSSPLSVSLLGAWTNDVYLVETPVDRYVLKIYGANWRVGSEIRYEIDLLDHLTARGVRVANAIRDVDGEALKHINLDGQQRQAVLFEFAAGEKPQPPFSSGMYEREGMATAALHSAADDFTSNHQRRYLDLDHLIDRPMALVASLEIDASTKRSILVIGKQLRIRIEAFVEGGLDWGVSVMATSPMTIFISHPTAIRSGTTSTLAVRNGGQSTCKVGQRSNPIGSGANRRSFKATARSGQSARMTSPRHPTSRPLKRCGEYRSTWNAGCSNKAAKR